MDKPFRFPAAVTDRLDAHGDALGVTSIPGALLKVDLDLTSDDILLILGLSDHYRRLGDKVFASYVRLGKMVHRDRKILANRAQHLDKRGLIARTRHGRVYKHDMAPLLVALETAPLMEFPTFLNDDSDKDLELARVKAENAALVEKLKALAAEQSKRVGDVPAPAQIPMEVEPSSNVVQNDDTFGLAQDEAEDTVEDGSAVEAQPILGPAPEGKSEKLYRAEAITGVAVVKIIRQAWKARGKDLDAHLGDRFVPFGAVENIISEVVAGRDVIPQSDLAVVCERTEELLSSRDPAFAA